MVDKGFWKREVDSGVPLLNEAARFYRGHARLPKDPGQLSKKEIRTLGKKLLSGNPAISEKEFIIMTLAHQTARVSLDILREYSKHADPELKIFTEFALEECEWWNEV